MFPVVISFGLSLGREHKDIENSRESHEHSLPWKRGGSRPNIGFLDSAHQFSRGVLHMSSPRMVLG
jgi:hypothetical protein